MRSKEFWKRHRELVLIFEIQFIFNQLTFLWKIFDKFKQKIKTKTNKKIIRSNLLIFPSFSSIGQFRDSQLHYDSVRALKIKIVACKWVGIWIEIFACFYLLRSVNFKAQAPILKIVLHYRLSLIKFRLFIFIQLFMSLKYQKEL